MDGIVFSSIDKIHCTLSDIDFEKRDEVKILIPSNSTQKNDIANSATLNRVTKFKFLFDFFKAVLIQLMFTQNCYKMSFLD